MTGRLIRIVLMLLVVMFVLGCTTTPPLIEPTATSFVPTPLAGPTPLPVRDPHLPGELFDYSAQSGDTLPALAAHFNTTVEEILAANPDLPDTVTTLPHGYPMSIPVYYTPLTGLPFHILPDSEVVYGPSVVEFDISIEIRQRPGFLSGLSDFAYKRQREAWQVVEVIARNYSVNPRVLLALLEYRTQALTKPFPEGDEATYPLGVEQPRYKGLFWQLIWAAERLNDGYYGWRTGTLREIELADGLLVRPDPWQNAGTVALHMVFAGMYNQEDFNHAVSPDGFYQTFEQLWGDPFDLGVNLIPGNLAQPELALPFIPNRIWDFTAGPHYSWGTSLPLGALDFGPPAEQSGCTPSAEWITAPAAGLIVRSDEAIITLDLDGDGDERTGWVLFFFHVGTADRIAEGTLVRQGDLLGHPSCEGGRATGTHLHLARRYNGEWIPAGGPLAFTLSGWVTAYGNEIYEGTLTKDSNIVYASEISSATSHIIYEFP
jgi:LasA protease